MIVERISIPKAQVSPDGFIKVNLEDIQFPSNFKAVEHSFIFLPPKKCGGNHFHPRREIFLCLNPGVELHWIDQKDGKRHVEKMECGSKVSLLLVNPMIPHAVINTTDQPVILIEFSDSPQYDAVSYELF